MATDAGVWLVRAAIEEAVGAKAEEVIARPSKHLADQSPLDVAQEPGGANIVLARLDDILAESEAR
jgi:uncharacterized protein (DUF2384 family)